MCSNNIIYCYFLDLISFSINLNHFAFQMLPGLSAQLFLCQRESKLRGLFLGIECFKCFIDKEKKKESPFLWFRHFNYEYFYLESSKVRQTVGIFWTSLADTKTYNIIQQPFCGSIILYQTLTLVKYKVVQLTKQVDAVPFIIIIIIMANNNFDTLSFVHLSISPLEFQKLSIRSLNFIKLFKFASISTLFFQNFKSVENDCSTFSILYITSYFFFNIFWSIKREVENYFKSESVILCQFHSSKSESQWQLCGTCDSPILLACEF